MQRCDIIYPNIMAMSKAEQETKYYEKLELIYRSYERSLDLELALITVPLNDAERERLLNDAELEARIMVLDARNKEDMIDNLRDLSTGALSEGVRLAALKEFGKTYYPKRFRDVDVPVNTQRVIRYEIVEPE